MDTNDKIDADSAKETFFMCLKEWHCSLTFLYPTMPDVTLTHGYVVGVDVHMCTHEYRGQKTASDVISQAHVLSFYF